MVKRVPIFEPISPTNSADAHILDLGDSAFSLTSPNAGDIAFQEARLGLRIPAKPRRDIGGVVRERGSGLGTDCRASKPRTETSNTLLVGLRVRSRRPVYETVDSKA